VNRGAIAALALAAALLGASIGVAAGLFAAHRLHAGGRLPWVAPPPPGGPGGRPPLRGALPRLARLLELTPEQVRRIEPKVIESQKQFDAARESLRSRIDAELTPEQRERWRAFERDHDRRRMFGPGGSPGHPDRPGAGEEGEPR
jgi:Spy/CpxP family protein refolding chaperone